MAEVTRQEWDAFLENHEDVHLLQSSAWGELKSCFGWNAVRVIHGTSGVQILFRKVFPGVSFGYIPKGPVGAADGSLFDEIDSVCRQRGAFFIRLEPDLLEDGVPVAWPERYIPVNRPIQPRRTILVDLQGTEDDWLAHMKQKTRYNIRLAQKKGVTVASSADISLFSKLMAVTGERDEFGVHVKEYYQKAYDLFSSADNCRLLVAEFEKEPLAAIMVFAYSKRAYYLYGASGNDNRNLMPNYLLQWEAMRWAASKNCQSYDLWGIPDENEETLEAQFTSRKEGLWPVYRFKRGFGGRVVRSAAPLDKAYNPLLYSIFNRFTSG